MARLSRAAYYKPGIDSAERDGEVIAALQAIVVEEQRWGFWKCRDRSGARLWLESQADLAGVLPAQAEPAAANQAPSTKRERQPLLVEPRMNAAWGLDFMRETLYSGRVFRTLNVIDEVRGRCRNEWRLAVRAGRSSGPGRR